MPRASRIGARVVGGQMTAMSAMSSVRLFAPEPVLSPTRPPFGTATRNRLSPVWLAPNQPVSCSRDV
jgi:hypothetical protein